MIFRFNNKVLLYNFLFLRPLIAVPLDWLIFTRQAAFYIWQNRKLSSGERLVPVCSWWIVIPEMVSMSMLDGNTDGFFKENRVFDVKTVQTVLVRPAVPRVLCDTVVQSAVFLCRAPGGTEIVLCTGAPDRRTLVTVNNNVIVTFAVPGVFLTFSVFASARSCLIFSWEESPPEKSKLLAKLSGA